MEQLEEKEIIPYDVIVVGAGAAGMMAAGTAARNGKRVLLIEKMEKSGRKVRITGKGRCNVTNARPAEEFASQVRTNAEFFAPAFAEFNNRAAIRFFERAGVKLEIERGERVFPKSGKAWDIATALLEYCFENGVKIIYNTRVTGIMTLGSKVFGVRYINKRGFERKEECPNVIVATGGLSYPATGSTGDGYAFASDLGHSVEPVRPSLTPLVSSHPQIKYLDGLLLRNVRATLWIDDQPVREEFGELGFSQRGIEGAVALREVLQGVPVADLGGWESFGADGVFCCADVTETGGEDGAANPMAAALEKTGARAVFRFAVRDSGDYRGWISFEDCLARREWTGEQRESLAFAAGIISLFLLKMWT